MALPAFSHITNISVFRLGHLYFVSEREVAKLFDKVNPSSWMLPSVLGWFWFAAVVHLNSNHRFSLLCFLPLDRFYFQTSRQAMLTASSALSGTLAFPAKLSSSPSIPFCCVWAQPCLKPLSYCVFFPPLIQSAAYSSSQSPFQQLTLFSMLRRCCSYSVSGIKSFHQFLRFGLCELLYDISKYLIGSCSKVP